MENESKMSSGKSGSGWFRKKQIMTAIALLDREFYDT